MIRFMCPTCDKILTVTDEKAGKIAVCPACTTRIIIPEAAPSPEAVTAEPPRKHRRIETDADEAPSSHRRRIDDDETRRPEDVDTEDDVPEAERDRPRKRKKKRRRKRALIRIRWLPFAFDPYLFTMAGLIFTAICLMGLSLAVPQFAYVSLVLGIGMYLFGKCWFLAVAFSDDATTGMLCLWCGIYKLIYLCMNFEETRRPFFVEMTGEFIIVSSIFASGMLE